VGQILHIFIAHFDISMPLDSHSAALLSQLGCAGAKPLHKLTPEQARAASRAMLALMRNDTPMHRVEDFDLAYAGGSFLRTAIKQGRWTPPAVVRAQ
jgi:hypothetical protein